MLAPPPPPTLPGRDTAAEIGRLYRTIARIVQEVTQRTEGGREGGGMGEGSEELLLSFDVLLIVIGRHFKQAPWEG